MPRAHGRSDGDGDGELGGSKRWSETCGTRGEIGIRSGRQEVLASVSSTVDEGNIVVLGRQESYIDNTCIGQEIPMNSVFVVKLDALAGKRKTKNVRFDEPNTNQNMEDIRERCETKTEIKARKKACATRIEGRTMLCV